MILYHGSNLTVENPRIITPNRFLDFGKGFYTTSNYEQAQNFADKVTARKKEGVSTVSIYELDDTKLDDLSVLSFEEADEKWLDFVSDNRNGLVVNEGYDIICGPVANDDIFRTFILYTTGVLTKEQTLQALKIKRLYNQYVFTNYNALEHLKFIEAVRR